MRTMNYVGQLAETVFGTVKELYRGLNPATLSGGIDVLVVKQEDGSFRCSPFHVRFGKLGVLRSREKVVDIEINGEPVDLHMKLGDSGEAFFVQELESDEPGTASEPEVSITGMASTGRKKRRRRRKPRRKEDVAAADYSSSEELEAGAESELNVQPEGESSPQPKDIYPYSDGECSPQASLSLDGLTPAKSDSELELRTPEPSPLRAESHLQWAWGRLPKMSPPLPPGSLKRSQHLGPSDIYLDDLPSLDSENAALYFPQRDCGLGARRWSEPESQKALGDCNPEQEPEPAPDTADTMVLSLCGGLADSWDISLEKFSKHIVSYQDLAQNPGLLDNPNLVVKINEKHYNWAVAAPMILCLQAFQKNLPKGKSTMASICPQSTVDKLEKEKMPRKGGRWWFSWRRRDIPAKEYSAQREKPTAREQRGERTKALSSEDDDPDSPVILEAPSLPLSPPAHTPTYKKSLHLSSNQIRRLNLQEGANSVVFSVTTQYQGTCRCRATIYLWKWDDKVVISDIDGTITKSDALGHILPQLGKDWTHQGITSLYHKIHLNGYKFLYCSARTIGMADLTKGYLQWVSERGCSLPEGPILLSPSSLFSALHREVIEKKPEVFKITCLSDIQQLFLPQGQPFYAAFGNRPNDVTAYRQVGLPESRIFTVNPRGELIQELMKNHKSTYERLSEVVELLFPPVARGPSTDLANPEYSNFCYWREPLAPVDLSALA
ncbi:Phosphatidate phosphatase LPIN3 [Camelus dromedarius]|uniref:phosphatidate phosphatase n=1 Tax=Camelus dromedarius TaxID=9838 RepID=A0A5N4CTU6_CAMDR|nr:Phosphatidate phosphatase LPIN3 [Camelus dromedarius]